MAKGRAEIDFDRCKGCELCTTACPQHLLSMGDRFNSRGYRAAVLVDPEEKCTGCTLCALICPDVVITVYRHEPAREASLHRMAVLA
jgi:2-oxoglutarate ferredoxin oxidoreductase subunit delta